MYPIVHVQCISTELCGLPFWKQMENLSEDDNRIFNHCPFDIRTYIGYWIGRKQLNIYNITSL